MTLDEQLAFLAKGAVDLIERNDLKAKLSRGRPLTIKVGFDPTAPDIHLGHTVVMRKMKHFRRRWEGHQPIALHELLYPLAQAYDSVALKCDVEMGGTDQLFNLLVGRDLMREYGLEPQVVLTMPLLEGLDGIEKMSKSLGNYIGISEEPRSMFGKVMSISDELMWKYYVLCTDLTPAEIEAKKNDGHPMEAKRALAKSIIRDFHDENAADEAEAEFT